MEKMIRNAAVLGAGTMGSGIAAFLAGAGLQVKLLDVVPRELTEEEKAGGLTEGSAQFRNRFANNGYQKIKDPKSNMLFDPSHIERISIGNMEDDMACLGECDWIIEAVVEDLQVKRELMRRVETHRRTGSLVTTNTSGISLAAICGGFPEEFQQHFMGAHFFNPVRYMKLLELIPGPKTDPESLRFMARFAEDTLGKGVIFAKDTPNFVANRIGVYLKSDTLHLTCKYGLTIPQVDQLTGAALGRPTSATFRTTDLVGLDIYKHTAENVLAVSTDEAERKVVTPPEFVEHLLKIGALGNKVKHGFYKREVEDGVKVSYYWDYQQQVYRPDEGEKSELAAQALKSENKYAVMVYGDAPENRFCWENIKHIILYSAGLVGVISDDFQTIDRAMVWGYNWEKGPFAIWDAIGFRRAYERIQAEGDEIPAWVAERYDSGAERLYTTQEAAGPKVQLEHCSTVVANADARIKDMGDGVLCLEFHCKANTINENVMDMMNTAVALLHGDWKGLVIGNQGKFFSAGGDLTVTGGLSRKGDFEHLEFLVAKLQDAHMKLKYAPRPVVAAPFGKALGGGAEVCMHADAVVPAAETMVGLVETGVGLIPAGGGCKELLLRAVQDIQDPNRLAMLAPVKRVWRMIIQGGTLCTSAFQAAGKGFFPAGTNVVMNSDVLLERAKSKVLSLAEGYRPAMPHTVPVLGNTGLASIRFDLISMKCGGFLTEYDAVIADRVAYILTGGDLPCGTQVPEQHILNLEREAFIDLCKDERTQARIDHLLTTGRKLHN